MQTGRQHLRTDLPVLRRIIAEAGDGARLIMIAQKQAVPRLSLQSGLPAGHHLLKLPQIHAAVRPFAVFSAVQIHMFKLKYHIQLFSVQ